MFEDLENGTVVDVIFPNSPTDSLGDLQSFMGAERSTNNRRKFYELLGMDSTIDAYNIREWVLSTEIELTKTDMVIPISLGYLVKKGTLKEYTESLTYYTARTDDFKYSSTNPKQAKAKLLKHITGGYVDTNDMHKEYFYTEGKQYFPKDYDRFITVRTYNFQEGDQ